MPVVRRVDVRERRTQRRSTPPRRQEASPGRAHGPYRATRSPSLQGEADPEPDECRTREALEPASRSTDERAQTVDPLRVERKPGEPEHRVDPSEQQGFGEHVVARRDELWQEREVEQRDLRVEYVREPALDKGGAGASRPTRVDDDFGGRPERVTDRADPEVRG